MVHLADRRARDGEQGMFLVFFALMMVVMIGFAALVIDLGIGRQKRRTTQNAADAAATAAAYELARKNGIGAATPKAQTFAQNNLPNDSLGWGGCVDSTPLPVPSGVPCISFNAALTRARVRVPTITLNTLLAGIIGTNTLKIFAIAEAEVIGGGGLVLPFVLEPSHGNGDEVCLKTQPEGITQPPCQGPKQGNFGFLNSPLYASGCSNGDANGRLVTNIVKGIDHVITVWTGGTPLDDAEQCPVDPPPPNQVDAQTGNRDTVLDDGLVGSNGREGRLALPGKAQSTITVKNGSPKLDNRPLWTFFSPLRDSVNGCDPTTIANTPGVGGPKAAMATCLKNYSASNPTHPLFDTSLKDSVRFSWVPQSADAFGNGASSYRIETFRPVFLETVFFGCNNNSCDGTFTVGETSPGIPVDGNKTADAVTSLLIPLNTLPPSIQTLSPDPFTARIIHLVK